LQASKTTAGRTSLCCGCRPNFGREHDNALGFKAAA
jgi:hypothetical protein